MPRCLNTFYYIHPLFFYFFSHFTFIQQKFLRKSKHNDDCTNVEFSFRKAYDGVNGFSCSL